MNNLRVVELISAELTSFERWEPGYPRVWWLALTNKLWNQDVNLDPWSQTCPLLPSPSFSHTNLFLALLQREPGAHFLSVFLSQAKASAQCLPGEWEFSLSFSRYTFWGCWSSPRHCRLEKLPQGDLTRWPPGGSEVWTARLSRPGSQEWWLSTLVAH